MSYCGLGRYRGYERGIVSSEWKLAFAIMAIALVVLALAAAIQREIIHDQRVYIEAGCHGRYQGD